MPLKTKAERLTEVLRRIEGLPSCSSFEEMRKQYDDTLNQVEDELTPFPYDPSDLNPKNRFRATDRMYPIQDDNVNDVPGHPLMKCLRSRGENTFIGANGSTEVRSKKRPDGTNAVPPQTGQLVFSKLGSDRRGVWDL